MSNFYVPAGGAAAKGNSKADGRGKGNVATRGELLSATTPPGQLT
jgi:hypothetical protein